MASKMTFPALSPEVYGDLKQYVTQHGQAWRGKLANAWSDPRVPEGPNLRNLRNTHGPEWLVRVNTKKLFT